MSSLRRAWLSSCCLPPTPPPRCSSPPSTSPSGSSTAFGLTIQAFQHIHFCWEKYCVLNVAKSGKWMLSSFDLFIFCPKMTLSPVFFFGFHNTANVSLFVVLLSLTITGSIWTQYRYKKNNLTILYSGFVTLLIPQTSAREFISKTIRSLGTLWALTSSLWPFRVLLRP